MLNTGGLLTTNRRDALTIAKAGRLMAMTPKQARFVEEYLVDLNATQAAIRAGYSAKTARFVGCENLSKPYIAEAIAAAQSERSARTEITQDYVLGIITEAIGLSRSTDNVMGFYKGAELLGKHLGMFNGDTAPDAGHITVVIKRD
jgi:hypothetical protein